MSLERRAQNRFPDHSLVFVELEAADPDTQASPKLALARTLDISAAGMQIVTREPLSPDRILRIFVDNGDDYPLSLVGEVRWTLEAGNEYQAGVAIVPSRETARRQWLRKVTEKGQQAQACATLDRSARA